ncbi:GTP 3',8-cyclase MoaA [Corynebacterium tapiri]|uniref:GTP 3',8-cyclase n=1 Tax=Corynebacterium tapiri TaxID=1448266 RepID=A0A5C4U648_9CORY|nr:GTP 3',8-cyclase MoaA [Corynebacterium tapiri]TNL99728.1 GTP 3',8-cyclase MoaA [Corynebacterium tapiri]
MTTSDSQPATPVSLPFPIPVAGRQGAPKLPHDLPDPLPDGSRELRDRFGRIARDLRISLTDRCNLRCTYCMPAEGLDWLPSEVILSDDEVRRLMRIAVNLLGIEHIRFTGGEPLLRKGLEDLVGFGSTLRTATGNPVQLALTTNALGLAHRAEALRAAGLHRVNISLDTVEKELFEQLTRRDRLDSVVSGIDAAVAAGLDPVKVNAVIMPGVNDHAIADLARFCLDRGAQLRFIEQMPLGPPHTWDRTQMISAQDILDELQRHFELSPLDKPRGSAPAKLWSLKDGQREGTIGVIASVSHPFCGACDRTRLTADGAIRSCLFSQSGSEVSLREALRSDASDEDIAALWAGAMWEKKPGHGIDDPGFLQPARPMAAIGG